MLAGVTSLIDGDNLKLCLIDSFRKGCFSCELAWVSSISQLKSFWCLLSDHPLTPDFQFIRIPETSGSERAASKHFDFCLDGDLLSSLLVSIRSGIEDIYNQSVQLDQDPFSEDILSGNEGEGF